MELTTEALMELQAKIETKKEELATQKGRKDQLGNQLKEALKDTTLDLNNLEEIDKYIKEQTEINEKELESLNTEFITLKDKFDEYKD